MLEHIKLSDLIPYVNNAKTHPEEQVTKIAASIKEFGPCSPILVDKDNGIVAGHGRLLAAKKLGLDTFPCVRLEHLNEAQRKAYILADNRLGEVGGSEWDTGLVSLELEWLKEDGFGIDLTGFDDSFILDGLGDPYADGVAGSMAEKYGQPPFSILDTRQGRWLDRKKDWRSRIGDTGESRDDVLGGLKSFHNGGGRNQPAVSLLDPVLAETMVAWFGTENGVAFDPFAGDTVFGFVSGSMGMGFHGIELRQEQVDLNQKRCRDADLPCTYYCDTGENMDTHIDDNSVDLVFSCPPYADLEVYSDNPLDLSAMGHEDFFHVYKRILQATYAKLKDNRFAVIVMGEVRGKSGSYLGTIPKTIHIMEEAGYTFYNEIILVNSAGTLPLRAGKSMQATRKVGKMHQNVLVFLKGNAKSAAQELGEIDLRIDDMVEE
jgi:16S rRNA G966 N2-methylase RsmD